jgi:ornithine carbamoyltransferase
MRRKDLLAIDQLDADELARLIARALDFKHNPFSAPHLLANQTLALLFQKPSLRTRVSFEVGMLQLGGAGDVPVPGRGGPGRPRRAGRRRARA